MCGRQTAAKSTPYLAQALTEPAADKLLPFSFDWESTALQPRQDTLDASAAAINNADSDVDDDYELDDSSDDNDGPEAAWDGHGGSDQAAKGDSDSELESAGPEPPSDSSEQLRVALAAVSLRELLVHPEKLAQLPLLAEVERIATGGMQEIYLLQAKVERDPAALTPEERNKYASLLPKRLRQLRSISTPQVELAIQGRSIDWVWLAHTNLKTLNDSVYELVINGKASAASRLVDTMCQHRKINPHTFASFFTACNHVEDSRAALERWQRWCTVRG